MTTKTRQPVTIDVIRSQIRTAVKKRYKMSVKEFCQSDKPKNCGLDDPADSIEAYLSDSGPVNYRIFNRLYAALGLGVLTREVKRTVITSYFFTKK